MTLLGATLAGGASRRFGSDKALAELDGRPLISHAAEILMAVTDAVIVCGRDVAPGGLTTVCDLPEPGLGPLGGLCAALAHAEVAGHDAVLSIGCDTPVLGEDLLDRLIAPGPSTRLKEVPIIGLWSVALAGPLLQHLMRGDDRSVRRWADIAGVRSIAAGYDIPNLNHAGELEALRRIRRLRG